MKIVFFHWNKKCGFSILRSFIPYIEALRKVHDVEEYSVPYMGANPINLIRNIWFVYKHRTNDGINHITGDIHYCILGLIGTKSVLTVHDDYAIVKAPSAINKLYKWLFWIFLPIKLAKRVVCISEETRKKISKLVKCCDMSVITQHTIPNNYRYCPKAFSVKCPIILQIGTTEQKNLETTIRAIRDVPCKLRVIKKMTDAQKKMADHFNINWTNAYNLTDDEILDEYKEADIVVFPSLYEGFGMPIIEAQAIGRPVITSNISPMNWVAGKYAALLNNPTDEYEYRKMISRLISDEQFRNGIVTAGLENVQRFCVDKVVERYVQLYKSI